MSEQNPWLTVWVEPRATIRQIIVDNPNRALWWLSAVYGFSSLLNSFQAVSLGDTLAAFPIFLIALVVSPLWGYIIFSVWSYVIYGTGKLLKGAGDFQHVRAAYAWSCVPLAVNALLWIVLIVFLGQELFVHDPQQRVLLAPGQAMLLFFVLMGKVVLAIWSLVIYVNALAEVQQYSILRALGNILLAVIVFGIAFGVVWALLLRLVGVAVEPAISAWETICNFGGL